MLTAIPKECLTKGTWFEKGAALNPQILSPYSSERLQTKPSSPSRSWRTLTFPSNQVELLHIQIFLTYLVTFRSHHLIMFIGSENSLEPRLQKVSWSVLIWECKPFVCISYGILYFLCNFFSLLLWIFLLIYYSFVFLQMSVRIKEWEQHREEHH